MNIEYRVKCGELVSSGPCLLVVICTAYRHICYLHSGDHILSRRLQTNGRRVYAKIIYWGLGAPSIS
jgi:hypothetical protein